VHRKVLYFPQWGLTSRNKHTHTHTLGANHNRTMNPGSGRFVGCGANCNCPSPHVVPADKLSSSHFQREYKGTGTPKDADGEAVRNGLTQLSIPCPSTPIEGQDATKIYTGNDHKAINTILVSDDATKLPLLCPYLKKVNYYINQTYRYPGGTVYRWTNLTDSWAGFPVGSIIRLPAFTSTSKSETATKHFGPHKIVIEVPTSFWGCRSIEDISHYKSEEEVLFPPYSAFLVKSNDGLSTVCLKAVDKYSLQ